MAAAIGAVVAGAVANRMLHLDAHLTDFRYTIAGTVVCLVVLFSAPLLTLSPQLMRAWRHGIRDYGALATAFGRQFENEWFHGPPRLHKDVLERPDFSAATDLYQVVERVQALRIVPVDLQSVLYIALATLVPFVPVVFIQFPLDVVVETVLGFLH